MKPVPLSAVAVMLLCLAAGYQFGVRHNLDLVSEWEVLYESSNNRPRECLERHPAPPWQRVTMDLDDRTTVSVFLRCDGTQQPRVEAFAPRRETGL